MTRTYQETIDYLFNRLPMYQRSGTAAIKKDLSNITALSSVLEHPHKCYPSIHIAGTNGKGTTAHLIAAVLQKMGLKVGLYTSPHYMDYRERIKVNGSLISKEYVISFLRRLEEHIEIIGPSFFEITVSMAFNYFRQQEVDIAVIETGLGGRLDSTNIIDPALSVITNISLDHQAMLGNNVFDIAKEKAGIIKKTKPVVIGKFQASCDQVFIEKAYKEASSFSFASINWRVLETQDYYRWSNGSINIQIEKSSIEDSPFIIENITTALEAIWVYTQNENLDINSTVISDALRLYRTISNYQGRWQILAKDPLVIADSAHNYVALAKILQHIRQLAVGTPHFIVGFVKDKAIDEILGLFNSTDKLYFICPTIERGLPVQRLKSIAQEKGLNGVAFLNINDALAQARSSVKNADIIFIGGSSFVVADALDYYKSSQHK